MYIEPWYVVLTLLLLETNGHPSCQDRLDSGKAVDDLKSQFVRLQAQIQDLKHKDRLMEKKIQFLLSKLSTTPVPGIENQYYNYMDEMAQASCVAMSPGQGWVFSVRRPCGGTTPTCDAICRQKSVIAQDRDAQTRGIFRCFNALHIIPNRPRLGLKYGTDTGKLGLKVFRYNSCSWTNCGPNYCCCKTQY